MNKKFFRPAAWLGAFLLLYSLTGCTGMGKGGEDSSMPASSDTESGAVLPVPEVAVRNPLTGEKGYDEALLNRRPVAVMINNVKPSLPQKGLADADIIYELPVEGAITRLMAVYSEVDKIPITGSVRSARHDFVELAKPLNAVYVHFGGSDAGLASIQENGVDSLNGVALSKTAFYFDEQRHQTKAREHCWFTNGELIRAGMEKKGYVLTSEQPPVSPFHFISEEERILSSYLSPYEAKSAAAPLSGEVTSSFSYDEAARVYEKGQYGEPHLDANTGEPVRVTNVFLLYPQVGLMEDGLHKEVDLSRGEGWYLSLGRAEKITFQKDGPDGLMKFYYAEGPRTAKELDVNPGKTWFSIAPSSYQGKLALGE